MRKLAPDLVACSCPFPGCAQPVPAMPWKLVGVLHLPMLLRVKQHGSLAAEVCDLQMQRGVHAALYIQKFDCCKTLFTSMAQERQAHQRAMQGKPPALAHTLFPLL